MEHIKLARKFTVNKNARITNNLIQNTGMVYISILRVVTTKYAFATFPV